jgi:hypothetical protein
MIDPFPYPLNKGPIGADAMEIPATAKDLTTAIKALGAEYNIDEFEDEFVVLAKSFGATESSLLNDEFNPVFLLEEGRKEDFKLFMKAVEDLDRKYKFQNFHDQCVYLRNAFDRERKGYLYDNVLLQCVPMAFFFPPEVADNFFQDWLDGVIEQEESVLLEYENLDGEVVRIEVAHKEDEYTIEYTECRPINRFVGDMPYDAFLVRYFWNENKGWVPVPIHLIKTYAVKH